MLDEHPPSSWKRRYLWAQANAHRLSKKYEIDLVFSPSGMLGPGWGRPQVVLAQNPWPFMRVLHRGVRDQLKALVQRQAFRNAQHHALTMVFNSEFMKELYTRSFGPARTAVVAYQGIDSELLSSGAGSTPIEERDPIVLTVSVMARHKNVETLVAAFAQVRESIEGAQLKIVGRWPDPGYRRQIAKQITRLGLERSVSFLGHVDRSTLNEFYAKARLFCLLIVASHLGFLQ